VVKGKLSRGAPPVYKQGSVFGDAGRTQEQVPPPSQTQAGAWSGTIFCIGDHQVSLSGDISGPEDARILQDDLVKGPVPPSGVATCVRSLWIQGCDIDGGSLFGKGMALKKPQTMGYYSKDSVHIFNQVRASAISNFNSLSLADNHGSSYQRLAPDPCGSLGSSDSWLVAKREWGRTGAPIGLSASKSWRNC
jgi:hypothetical protein